jgi:hypothetical protein
VQVSRVGEYEMSEVTAAARGFGPRSTMLEEKPWPVFPARGSSLYNPTHRSDYCAQFCSLQVQKSPV